jgi:hypothetical protein
MIELKLKQDIPRGSPKFVVSIVNVHIHVYNNIRSIVYSMCTCTLCLLARLLYIHVVCCLPQTAFYSSIPPFTQNFFSHATFFFTVSCCSRHRSSLKPLKSH